jgi:two-component system nitrate/nitrite response regulator NarL
MAKRTATIIIEPHLLVREALEALIKSYRYRVVCSVGSTADIDDSTMAGDGPKLVILGAESTDDAISEAVSIRKLWSNSKIVLLFEHASIADFQKLLTSEVDGCFPLCASPETLIRTLDLVTIEEARVVVTTNARSPAIRPSPTGKARQPQGETDGASPGDTERDSRSINMVSMPGARPMVNGYSAAQSNGHERDAHWTPSLPNKSSRRHKTSTLH